MITLSSPSAQPSQPDTIRVEHDADSDPRIASLKSMFPDFDAAVMYVDVYPSSAPTYPPGSLSVLESVDNDEDRALDVLLGMNDPTYISSAAPPPTAQPQPDPTQQDLDEQLARRLALEEEQAAGAWSADRQPGRDHQQQAGYQAYQPRSGSGRGWGSSSWGSWGGAQSQTAQSQGQGGQRDTMAEFQEGFNKIAECTSHFLGIIHSCIDLYSYR